ncbi:hypothetical protein PF008_g26895 [Phytophthora fragariae]|uniref:Protein kinase domain-containing protein n=1 Tax=Phytophthora fragariae TaxID=53985 RepID=A0A6G0QFQ3_9STRA|nr:hypothetical protein PF008_g26895 [Phytophthora fragariae]
MATSSSSSIGSSSSGHATGFKVYGSVFKVSSRYQFLNPLGKGSYGIVCAAKDRETGQCVAIKKVSPMTKRTVDAKHTLREVLLLQLLGKHPNVISVHNLSTNLKDDELYIVMDLMDTDMHRVIQSSQRLSDAHAKYFLHQLLRGVKYLHDNGVLHRDLKPGNLLLSKTCQLKIADFGLARKIPRVLGSSGSTLERPRSAPAASSGSSSNRIIERPPMTEHVVTRWYRAPELMLQPDGLYDQSVDMWSVGCIFAEILGRKALFPGKNFLHQLTLIFDVIGAPPPEATTRIQSSQAQRFLRSLGQKPKVPFPKPPDPVVITSRGGTSTAWQTNKSRNPESSSSSSSASSPASPPRSDASDSQKCCGVSRSNRPGSAMLLTTSKRPKPVNPTAAKLTGRPRRVSSAGSVRSKSRPLTATGSLTARATNTYVGSVNSLMRAQRSNAGQSLAESANSMLATISRNEHQEESSESREEASQLKPQRSSSQLHCSDAVGKRHPAKKLTVPRSPKFSVMSWQKKREASSRVGSYATGIPH